MRKIFDAIIDILILAVLIFTVVCCVEDVFMKYILVVVGCGAMFNNVKYLYCEHKCKNKNNPKK